MLDLVDPFVVAFVATLFAVLSPTHLLQVFGCVCAPRAALSFGRATEGGLQRAGRCCPRRTVGGRTVPGRTVGRADRFRSDGRTVRRADRFRSDGRTVGRADRLRSDRLPSDRSWANHIQADCIRMAHCLRATV